MVHVIIYRLLRKRDNSGRQPFEPFSVDIGVFSLLHVGKLILFEYVRCSLSSYEKQLRVFYIRATAAIIQIIVEIQELFR